MTAARAPSERTWALLTLVGLAALIGHAYVAMSSGGIHHPDQHMQYVEPAYWKLHGAAWLPWEYSRGLRNWALPAHYGALLALGESLGVTGLHSLRLLAFHNALLTLLLVPAGFRLGRALGHPRGGDDTLGLALATSFALFPPMLAFSPHTLSEVHGLVLTTWAYVYWFEYQHEPRPTSAFRTGLLLGLAMLARFTLLAFVGVIGLSLVVRRDRDGLVRALAGFSIGLLLLGGIDALTWGVPFRSLAAYVQFNLIAGGASRFGTSPWYEYLRLLFIERLPLGAWALLIPLGAALRRHAGIVAAGLLPLAAFSLIGHKEERFVLSVWPLLLAGALVGTSAFLAALRATRGKSVLRAAALAFQVAVLLGSGFVGAQGIVQHRLEGLFAAQRFVGEQPDATGLLVDYTLDMSGGYAAMGKSIPLAKFKPGHSDRMSAFNYIALFRPSTIARVDRTRFEEVASFEDRELGTPTLVFRRREGNPGDTGQGD